MPTAPVTVAVALADKLDTLAGFFAIGDRPTGSKDPFALRRAALGDHRRCIIENGTAVPHLDVVGGSERRFRCRKRRWSATSSEQLLDFFADRLKVQQREAGVRHDLIDAVFALGGEDDLVRLLARVNALQAFVETEDGRDLLAGYKRAANILKKENWDLPRVMARRGEQGIPQTGEEDPLSEVEEPAIAAAVAEMAVGSTTPADAPGRGEGARRRARRGRAQGQGGGRGRGFHRRDGGAGLAARADRRLLRQGDGQRPRQGNAGAAAEPARPLPRRGSPGRGLFEDRRLNQATRLAAAATIAEATIAPWKPGISCRALLRQDDAEQGGRDQPAGAGDGAVEARGHGDVLFLDRAQHRRGQGATAIAMPSAITDIAGSTVVQ